MFDNIMLSYQVCWAGRVQLVLYSGLHRYEVYLVLVTKNAGNLIIENLPVR